MSSHLLTRSIGAHIVDLFSHKEWFLKDDQRWMKNRLDALKIPKPATISHRACVRLHVIGIFFDSTPRNALLPGRIAAARVAMRRNKIIIIEDDEDLRTLMALALKGEHFEVAGFTDGNEFLQQGAAADLYIIDINLGGMTGLELCKRIKTNAGNSPVVIIVSANPDLGKMAEEVCADDALPKPFTTRDLLNKVVGYLASEYSTYG